MVNAVKHLWDISQDDLLREEGLARDKTSCIHFKENLQKGTLL